MGIQNLVRVHRTTRKDDPAEVGKGHPVQYRQAVKPVDPVAVKLDLDPIPVAQRKDAYVQAGKAPTARKAQKAALVDLAVVKINVPAPGHQTARNEPPGAAAFQHPGLHLPALQVADRVQVEQAEVARLHPTEKPVEPAAELVQHGSRAKTTRKKLIRKLVSFLCAFVQKVIF